MVFHALALLLASAPAEASTLSVKVVSLNFSYPYFGEPGNTCQRGSVFVHAVADPNGPAPKPVVVRLVDSAGLTPGAEAVLADVRRAGAGRDGTPVYCATGRLRPGAPAQVAPVAPAADDSVQPPLVQAQPAAPAAEPSQPAPAPAAAPAPPPAAGERCTARLFHVVKKPLPDNKFGPSEFDPESGQGAPEAVDCSVARSRVTNVLLLKMVKDGSAKPEAVLGAEWAPGSTWQRAPDAPQRRAVKVYLAETN